MGLFDNWDGGGQQPPTQVPGQPPAQQPTQQPPAQGGLFDNWNPDQPAQPQQKGPDNNWANPVGVAGEELSQIFGKAKNDFMAVGKSPKGEAYYGEGFAAWSRKTFAKLTDPTRINDGIDYKTQDAIDTASKGVAEQWAKDNPQLSNFKDYVYATTQFGGLFQSRVNKGEVVPATLETANSIATGAADVLIGGVMQVPSAITREGTAAGQALQDVANPDFKPDTGNGEVQAVKGVLATLGNPLAAFIPDDVLKKAGDLATQLSPATNSWNLIRYAGQELQKGNIGAASLSAVLAPIALSMGPFSKAISGIATLTFSDAQQIAIRDNDLKGANTIFTQMWDSQVKADIQRELMAGTPPQFIEEKYANPWVEMAGGVLTDPLTYIGAIEGQGAHAAKFLSDAQDVGKALPEIQQFAKIGLDSGHSGVQAMEYLQNGIKAIDKVLGGKFEDLTKLVNVNNLEHLTSSGKQFMLNRQLGSFTKQIVSAFKDPEDAAHIFYTMAKYATSSDETAKAAHLTELMASPVGVNALSGPGTVWMATARKMLETTAEDGTKSFGSVDEFISTLTKNGMKGETAAEKTANLADYMAKKMEGVTSSLFPSVDEMEAATKAVKAGSTAVEDVRKAKMLEDVPQYVRTVNAALGSDSKVKATYNAFNSFFAAVYMGMSPGFAVRNVLSNSVGILADSGLRQAVEISGASVASFFDKGASYERYLNGMADMVGGHAALPSEIMSAAANKAEGEGGSILNFGMKASGNAERVTRLAIMHNSAAEVMDNFFRNGLTDLKSGLTGAGMPQQHIDTYLELLKKNYGNTDKTMTEFNNLLKTNGGNIPEWRTVQPPDRLLKFLSSLGLDKQLTNDVRFGSHPNAESISAAISKYKNDFGQVAEQALKEPVFPTEGSPEALIAHMGQDVGKGLKGGDSLSQAYTSGMGTLQSARQAAYDATNKEINTLLSQAAQAGDIGAHGRIMQALQMAQAVQAEAQGPEIAGGANAFRSLASDLVRKVRSGETTVEEAIASLSKTMPGGFQADVQKYAAEFGQPITQANFGDAIYRHIQPSAVGDWWEHLSGHTYQGLSNAITLATGDATRAETVLATAKQHMRDGMEIFQSIRDFKAAGGGIESGLLTDTQKAQGVVNDLFKAATDGGFERNKAVLLSGINKDARAAGKAEYSMLREVPPEEIVASIKKRGGPDLTEMIGQASEKTAKYEQPAATILADAHGGAQHTLPGAINKQYDGLLADLTKYEQDIASKFNNIGVSGEQMSGDALKGLETFNNNLKERLLTARMTAVELGRQKADFAIHAYGDKTHLDTALAMVMPYHYWQGRTYAKWAERMVYRPDLVSAYGKYRHALETAHAGLPDWWKYNITSNDVLGTNNDNPMYFNLESSLNPVNGLTGVDFNDSKKRVDWFTRTVDDLGKFGPGLFTPIQWLAAASSYAQGKNDAAARWMGRAVPFTQQLKQGINALGIPAPQLGSYGKYGEYDPFVNLFSGGLDPYERPRVGRAMGAMQDEQIAAINADNTLTQAQKDSQIGTVKAQYVDAANNQSGALWDKGVQRSLSARAPGALASYIMGVGFKNRSVTDMQIDNFYADYTQLMSASSNIAPDKFHQAMGALQTKYPWMDTVLISRKADGDRQTAYAYNVIGRVPPGQSSDLYAKVGLTSDLVNKFYTTKGSFDGFSEQDVSRFNAGIADLGTLLAMPDQATKQEWDAVKNQTGYMYDAMKQQFGADIQDKMALYFNKSGDDQKTYMQQHPELQAAFDYKAAAYASHPLLNRYYGGVENLQKYYQSQMYTALDAKYGNNIQQEYNDYGGLKLTDPHAASAYWHAHPELGGYSNDKKVWQDYILHQTVAMGANLPDGPSIPIRNDFQQTTPQQQDLYQTAADNAQKQPSWSDIQSMTGMSPSLNRLVQDYWIHGDKLSATAQKSLDYAATKNGYKNSDDLLRDIGISLYQEYGQTSGQ